MPRSPFEQLRAMLARLTLSQKITLVLAAAVATAGIWGVVALANRIRYEVLFSNLEPEDAASIVAKLEEGKIDHRIDAGGRTVSVPSDKVAEVRLSLAGEGLPRGGGVGFEIFDRSTFDLSDFVQSVNYQRAMERELARTIEALDAVAKARVHLVLPPRTMFAEEGQETKASVVVKLVRGRELRRDESLAVANLVSSAVRGLSPEKVSIVDTDGKLLKDGAGDDSVQALSAHQLEVKSSFEREMQSKLITLLTPIVGEGRVRARVDATLDFQQVQRVEEMYDGEKAVVRSEQKGRQRRASGSGGGAPGTPSNLPTGAPVAATVQSESDESTDSLVNYEIPKTVSTVTEPIGDVKKLSVAVVVDNAVKYAKPGDASQAPQSVVRSDDEMKKIGELVRAAAGLDDARGDVLTVANLPFDLGPLDEQKEALGTQERREFYFQVVKWPSLVVGALMLFLFVIRPALKTLKTILTPAPSRASAEALLLEPGAAAPPVLLRKKLIEISASEPEGAAQVVRGWLKEKR